MAIPSLSTFYLGLLLIVMGTGLLKGNVSVIVGQLYGAKDTRRDAGFSIFYMGINLGAFIAPLICGYLGQRISWHWVCGRRFGMVALKTRAGANTSATGAARRKLPRRSPNKDAAAISASSVWWSSAGTYRGDPVTAVQIADAAGPAPLTGILRVFYPGMDTRRANRLA
jgi:MFS family permease